MRRLPPWSRRALLAAGLLLVVGLIGFELLESWARKRLLSYVGKQLGGGIAVGDVELSLLRPQEIRDFLIRDPNSRSYIKIRSVRIEVGLLQVLGLSLQGKRLILDRPEVQIVRDAKGVHLPLWQRFLEGTRGASGAAAPGTLPVMNAWPGGLLAAPKSELPWRELDLEQLQIIDGRILLDDRTTGTLTRVEGLQASLQPVNVTDPISFTLSCRIRTRGRPDGSARLAGKLQPFHQGQWAGRRLSLECRYTLEGIELGPLSPFLPALPTRQVAGRGSLSGDARLTSQVLSVRLETRLAGFRARGGLFPETGFSLPQLAHRLALTYDGERVAVEQAALTAPGLELTAQGSVTGYAWTRGVLAQLPHAEHRWLLTLEADLARAEKLLRRFLPAYPLLIEGTSARWEGPVRLTGKIAGTGPRVTGHGTGRLAGERPFDWTLAREQGAPPEGRVQIGGQAYEVLPGLRHFLVRRKSR